MDTSLYLRVREREGRLYPDDIVRSLPEIPASHPLHAEWRARATSLRRLTQHISRLPVRSRLLELGCGNGWLSHRLSELPDVQVVGVDLLGPELVQAARLFGGRASGFVATDIFSAPFGARTFDLIIVASVIQYFPDLHRLLRCLQELLTPAGALHILDSPLYKRSDLPDARQRTEDYYAALGIPAMAAHYFHHTFEELEQFQPRWLYRPASWGARVRSLFGGTQQPFPWLSIKKIV